MSEPAASAGADGAQTAAGFAVELPVFAGPFRLLADLILEQKVDVCDVSVASVTDGYLAYAKDAEAWNLEEATWFLAICAVLLELKVGRLMPKHAELDEEDILGRSPDLAVRALARAGGLPPGGGRARAAARGRGRVLRPRRRARAPSSRTCTPTRWRRSRPTISRGRPRSSCGLRRPSTSPT